MENVQIRCGACQQVIAVSPQHLGQQVQCPLCRQVVQAPAPSPPSEEKTFDFQGVQEERESIFGETKETDDLFADEAPRLEIPPPPSPPSPAPPPVPDAMILPDEDPLQTLDLTSQKEAPAEPHAHVDVPIVPPVPPPQFTAITESPVVTASSPVSNADAPTIANEEEPFYAPVENEHSAGAMPWQQGASDDGEAALEGRGGGSIASSVSRQYHGGGMKQTLLTLTLIMWAILATIAAGILKYRASNQVVPDNQLETMPDIEGEKPGAILQRESAMIERSEDRAAKDYSMPDPHAPLSDRQIVRLNEELKIGDLKVKPLRVVVQPITTVYVQKIPSPSGGINVKHVKRRPRNALALYLRIENDSRDLRFYPLDNYFVRRWRSDEPYPDEKNIPKFGRPYTFLEISPNADGRFYGGPGQNWVGRMEDGWVQRDPSQLLQKPLSPRDSMVTFLCTDPTHKKYNEAFAAIKDKPDHELTWRVRVRRGGVKVNGSRKPACAVIGIKFKVGDIQNLAAAS